MTLYTIQHAYTGEILGVHATETADEALTEYVEAFGLGRSEPSYEVGGVVYTVLTNYEIAAVPNLCTSGRRYAVVSTSSGMTEDGVDAYLPDGYSVEALSTEGRRGVALISGWDMAGWTLDGYVLPRLASGMYYGHECGDYDDAVATFHETCDDFLRASR